MSMTAGELMILVAANSGAIFYKNYLLWCSGNTPLSVAQAVEGDPFHATNLQLTSDLDSSEH